MTFCLGLPQMITFQRIFISIWATHFNVSGGAANQRRNAAGFMCVFGKRRHEG